MKSKKAAIVPVWVPGLVLISLIVLTTSVIYLNQKVTNLTVVGEAQQQVFETAATAEKALVYTDAAAGLSAQQTIFDLAYGGGYELKQGCGWYLGFNMWATSEDDCYPEEDIVESNFEDSFLNSFSGYLSLYTEINLSTDYEITEIGENPVAVIGSAFSNIRIPIYATAERLPQVTQPTVSGVTPTITGITSIIKPPKVTYTQSQAEIKSTIIRLAQKYNVSTNVALAVAYTESKIIQTRTKNGVVELYCNINGPDSEDCGVMQINTKVHSGCYDANAKDRDICSVEECKGMTVYDTTCNIAAGLNLLKQNYEKAQAIAKSGGYVYCKGKAGDERTYTDPWDIALRLYNGRGCKKGLTQYVEIVRANEKGIETATMVG